MSRSTLLSHHFSVITSDAFTGCPSAAVAVSSLIFMSSGFWSSCFPQHQRSGWRVGNSEETETPYSWRPLVDVRLQPGVQAAVRGRLHVRWGIDHIAQSRQNTEQHLNLSLQVRPVRGVRRFPDATAGAVWPVAVSESGGLFRLPPNRENHLHHLHGHGLFHLHGPQHDWTHLSGCKSSY